MKLRNWLTSVLSLSLSTVLMSGTASATASEAWDAALKANTAESYANFALSYPKSRWVDQAICNASALDSSAAQKAIQTLQVSFPTTTDATNACDVDENGNALPLLGGQTFGRLFNI